MSRSESYKRDIADDLKSSGLWFLVKVYRLWSFRLDAPPSTRWLVNRFYVGLVYLVFTVIMIDMLVNRLADLFDASGGIKYDVLCLNVVMGSSYVTNILHFTFAIRSAQDYRLLFLSLSTSLNSIPDRKSRARCVRQIKIVTVLSLLPLALSYSVTFFGLLKHDLWVLKGPDVSYKMVLKQLVHFCNVMWVSTSGAFYVFTNCCIGLVSYLLSSLMTFHLKEQSVTEKVEDLWESEEPRGSPARKMILLQKISLLIQETDYVFSKFLLLSMCFESILAVAIIKVMGMKIHYVNATTNLIQILMFVFKAYVCGHVNTKFESYLKRKVSADTPQDLTRCSAEEINFHFYLNEQLMNRAQLTYGGLFAVRKTFIFTIAGTAITYALLIQEMPS